MTGSTLICFSGHRRYGQRNGDGDYTIKENTEEDNWRYVDASQQMTPLKPVLDGEPSYEDIPQGLHDFSAPRWQDYDVRRYAYWSVFAGSFGHTYGHNSIIRSSCVRVFCLLMPPTNLGGMR